jgi:PAS domain S-box-containing protein
MDESTPTRGLEGIDDPRALLEGLFEHAPVAFQIFRADGHSLMVNKAFRALFGSEPPPDYNIFKDEIAAQQGMVDLIRRAFAGETVSVPAFWYDARELEHVEVTEGRRVAIELTLFPLLDAHGNVRQVASCAKDVTPEMERLQELTERKRTEEALRRSEGRFTRLSGSGLIGIITTDYRGNILEANDAFLNIVGYSAHEVLTGSITWAEMTPPEWRYLDDRAVEQLKTVGIAPSWEKEYLRKDGTRIPVLVGVATLEGRAEECVAFVLDLSERNKAEAAARESEARNTAVMEAALDAIVIMDHEGKIAELNPAAERTFGHARHEVVGKSLADVIVPPSLRGRHSAGLERYLKTAEGHVLGTRIEVPALRKDGTEFPAEVAVVRIRSEGPPIFTGYIRDITERRQAAEGQLLRRAKEAADEANTELEAFSYSVAHDLRAPLRAINGFSTALLDDWGDRLDEEAKGHLARISGAAERMAELIDALLALARLTRIEPRRETVDLTDVAIKVMEQLRAGDPARNVAFSAAEGLVAQGDSQLLRALFENLLGNAWKFTSRRNQATIEVGREDIDGVSTYYVRDDGVGFDMSHVGKIFAPFRRLHTTDEFEGSGIGLATVQRIVRRHGGRIWAEGVENRGATFRFTLSGKAQSGGPHG